MLPGVLPRNTLESMISVIAYILLVDSHYKGGDFVDLYQKYRTEVEVLMSLEELF